MVIFDELDAVRSEEYRTQHIQMPSPTILWLSKVLSDFNPITPRKPGLHISSKKNHSHLKILFYLHNKNTGISEDIFKLKEILATYKLLIHL